MIKSVTAIYRFCIFKVDARHKHKWLYKTIIATYPYKHILIVLNVLYCHQLFIPPHNSWLSNRTEGTQHVSSRCNDSHASVMYNRWTHTRILSSKFPRKTWGAMDVQRVAIRCSSPSAWE